MADFNGTLATVQEDLESMVECPIHYGILAKPKSLPCGHVVCRDCIERWIEARMGVLVCPECNGEQILPQNGVDGLPNAYRLVQLCDYLGKTKVSDSAGGGVTAKTTEKCSSHKDHCLDRICRDCKQPVCQECAKSEHAGHMCLDVGIFMEHMDRPLKKLEKQAREKRTEAARCSKEFIKMREQLTVNRDASIDIIDRFVEKLIEKATSAGDQLREQVEVLYEAKNGILQSQENTLQEITEDISGVVRVVDEGGRGSVDAVSSLPSLVEEASKRLMELQNKLNQSAPRTSSDIWAEMNGTIFEWFQLNGTKTIGAISTSEIACPNECKLKMVSETPTLLSQEVEVELTLNDEQGVQVKVHDSNVISAEVLTANGNRVKQVFENGRGGKFVTRFRPMCIGKYRLITKVFNVHVKNSPLNIIVRPRGIATSELKGYSPFHSPHDVRKVGNNFIVLDEEHVQVVDGEGRMVNRFVINENVFHPYAVAYFDQAYYITALKGQKVVKFSRTGLPIREIGRDVLQAPTGIAVAKNGDIYVADDKMNCIYVFSDDGVLQHQLGGPGTGKSELSHPWFIKYNHRGQLLVADSGNQRIQIFDPRSGKGVMSIQVEHEGRSLACRGIDVDSNDNIFVTGRAVGGIRRFVFECVMVYTPDGEFIGSFAESPRRTGLNYVRGIHVVDNNGKTTAIVVDGNNAGVRLYAI